MEDTKVPRGWVFAAVEDVISSHGIFTDGDWVETKDQDPNGDVRLIQLADIGDGSFLDKSSRFLTKSKAYELNCTFLNKGDLLVARMPDPLGRCCIFPLDGAEKFITVVDVCTVRPGSSSITPKYLTFAINSPRTRMAIEALKSGSTRKRISRRNFASVQIPLAPRNEQRRIVAKIEELFSELDKGVESLKTVRAQLEVYRQAVLKHAFEGKLTTQWREENQDKIETADQLINRVPVPVQPRGGRAPSVEVIEGVAAMAVNIPSKKPPSGWSWVPLLRIARQETGHTPSRKHSDYWNGDQYWIGIPDARLHDGKEIQDTIQKVTRKGLENSSARTLPAETVCLSRTASVGYVCLMTKPMATSQDFATWTCTQALKPKFLMYALMAEGDDIRRFGKGTTHTTIYFPEIRAMTICLPPLEEQSVIIGAVETKLQHIDTLNAEIDAAIARCNTIRQAILKKAFSGELVDQDPNDEPAATLLMRIKAEKASQKPRAKTRQRKVASA